MSADAAIVVRYRGGLHPGADAALLQARASARHAREQRGSLGSRLDRGSDGAGYGDARWPDAAREAVPGGVSAAMAMAVESAVPTVVLAPVADLLHAVRLTSDRRPG